MTKPTPGPWSVKEEWGRTSREAEQGIPLSLCFHSIIAEDDIIASTWGGPNMANAHLIAAAPDLLEACKAAENHYAIMCEVFFPGNPPPSGLPVLEKLRAAIAKAEGKDHD